LNVHADRRAGAITPARALKGPSRSEPAAWPLVTAKGIRSGERMSMLHEARYPTWLTPTSRSSGEIGSAG
jgi:hypothetical protein